MTVEAFRASAAAYGLARVATDLEDDACLEWLAMASRQIDAWMVSEGNIPVNHCRDIRSFSFETRTITPSQHLVLSLVEFALSASPSKVCRIDLTPVQANAGGDEDSWGGVSYDVQANTLIVSEETITDLREQGRLVGIMGMRKVNAVIQYQYPLASVRPEIAQAVGYQLQHIYQRNNADLLIPAGLSQVVDPQVTLIKDTARDTAGEWHPRVHSLLRSYRRWIAG